MKTNRSITIRDVAKRAGVSIATVSRYINKNIPVSMEVGENIQKTMEELDFIPNSAARNLAKNKYYAIGLLLTDMIGDFFSVMVNEIERATREAGYDLLISICRDSEIKTRIGPSDFPVGPQNTDGVIIFADAVDDADLRHAKGIGFPVVLIARAAPAEFDIPGIGVENIQSTQDIISHLIEVHHRQRIVYLRGLPTHQDTISREAGYRRALEAHNIPYQPDLVTTGDFNRQIAYQSILDLLSKKISFDAVFSGDDESAIGVLAALSVAGVRVPEQVSVVGFDDQDIASFLLPPLTTVRAPFEVIGRKAVEQLLKIINGQEVEPFITVPSEVIIRHSCGC